MKLFFKKNRKFSKCQPICGSKASHMQTLCWHIMYWTCISLLLDLTEGVWRHFKACGAPYAIELQELLVVFEEHLSRSLHSWSQPTPLWLGKITDPHHQLSPFQTSELCLATVGFHFGSPEGILCSSNLTPLKALRRSCLNSLHWMLVFHFVSLHCFPPLPHLPL